MIRALRPRHPGILSLVLLGALGLLVSGASLVPIERTVTGKCIVMPIASWTLNEVRPGSFESRAVDRLTGEILHLRLYQFDRPTFIDFELSELGDAHSRVWCDSGQTLASISSSSLNIELAACSTRLVEAKAALSAARTGAKPELVEHGRLAVRQAMAERDVYTIHATRQQMLHEAGLLSDDAWEEVATTMRLRELDVHLGEAYLDVLMSGASPDKVRAAASIVTAFEREVEALRDVAAAQEIRSPICGWLRLGEADEALVSVSATDPVIVEAIIPQHHADKLAPGQRVRAFVPGVAGNLPEGTIVRVDRRSLHSTAGPFLYAFAQFENADGLLEERMQGRVRIYCGHANLATLLWETVRHAFQWS